MVSSGLQAFSVYAWSARFVLSEQVEPNAVEDGLALGGLAGAGDSPYPFSYSVPQNA